MEDALHITLDGTGLTGFVSADGVITVVTSASESEFQEGDLKVSSVKKGLLGSASALMASVFALTPATAQGANDEAGADSIVVTGTRIVRPNLSLPTPVTSVDAEDIRRGGVVDIADVVSEIPALALGQGRSTTNFSFDQQGLNTLNLRGLGISRSLVLVDGRRHVGAAVDLSSAVDISTIPSALVERVDVITGGASAIYGADAVAGVVNFIMKDDFEGVLLETQAGIAGEGDGEEFSASLTIGGNIADGRGNITAHFSYLSREPVLAADREWSSAGAAFVDPTLLGITDSAFDLVAIENQSTIFASPSTIIANGDTGGPLGSDFYIVNDDLSVRPFDAGTAGVFGFYNVIGSELPNLGPGDESFQVAGATDRYLLNLSSHYELTDSIRLFFDGKYSRTEATGAYSAVGSFSFVEFLSLDNPFIQPDLLAVATSAGASGLYVNRASGEFGPRAADTQRDTMRVALGVEGELWDAFNYELYYQYGFSDSTATVLNDRFDARWFQALDVISDVVTGQPVCRDPSNGCVPVNILGPQGVISPAALDFVRIPSHTSSTSLDQQVVAGHIAGPMPGITLPAGDIEVAAGFEYRKEARDNDPSLAFTAGLGYFGSVILPLKGEYDTTEFFGEVAVPVVSGAPFAEELTLDGAVRFADYSTVGSNVSYKGGALWTIVNGLTLRGTYAKAVRAPNITELFAPINSGGAFLNGVTDPCSATLVNAGSATRFANCQAAGVPDPNTFVGLIPVNAVPVTFGGNPGLTEETANTFTVGAVIRPEALIPGLSLTVDYYSIEIDDYIEDSFNGGAQNVLNACVDAASINNQFCDAVTRGPTGEVTAFRGGPTNISRLEMAGIDFAMNYQRPIGAGELSINGTVSHVLDRTLFVGGAGGLVSVAEDQSAGEIGNPKWRATANIVYEIGGLTLNVSERYLSKQTLDVAEAEGTRDRPFLNAQWYTDVQAAYDVTDDINVYAGINNLFDNEPPIHPYTNPIFGAQFGSGLFDPIGRYFYAGARVNF